MFNPIFVILGAALWATDTIFRHPMTSQISAISIVFLEHVFALALAAVWALVVKREKMNLHWMPVLGAAMVGIFGSALATLFFTLSFQFMNPTVSILLQKTQPIAVIFISWVFLGEKLSKKFFIWGLVALVAAFFLSFPHGVFSEDLKSANHRGVFLALLAAFFWAVSTVIGKSVLKTMSGSHLTFFRFLFGLLAIYTLMRFFPQSRIELPFIWADNSILRSIFFMALVPGFLGVTLYYRGLSKMNASVATLLELAFPLSAIFVNSYFLNLHLENVQLIAAAALMFAILNLSRVKH